MASIEVKRITLGLEPPTPMLALCCDHSASHIGQWQGSEADLHASRNLLKLEASENNIRLLDTIHYCTDGNTAFGCDSDKNSLVFIYMF